MNPKENALRIVRFDQPERVIGGLPGPTLAYGGCNHEGFAGGGHNLPAGSRWTDIWGTGWHKEHDGWMGYPNVRSVLSHVGLPEGFAIALGFKEYADGRCLRDALIGRKGKHDERIVPGPHAFDGSCTSLSGMRSRSRRVEAE
jgi:hypothetical protein